MTQLSSGDPIDRGRADNTAVPPKRRSKPYPFRSFLAVPMAEKLAIGPAWLLLGLSAAAIRVVPFVRLAPVLGRPVEPGTKPLPTTAAQHARARFIRRSIERAVHLAPFRSNCLPQALVCSVLCRWLGVPALASLGVRLDEHEADEPMKAHAWVIAGGFPIVGGQQQGGFTAVVSFLIHD